MIPQHAGTTYRYMLHGTADKQVYMATTTAIPVRSSTLKFQGVTGAVCHRTICKSRTRHEKRNQHPANTKQAANRNTQIVIAGTGCMACCTCTLCQLMCQLYGCLYGNGCDLRALCMHLSKASCTTIQPLSAQPDRSTVVRARVHPSSAHLSSRCAHSRPYCC